MQKTVNGKIIRLIQGDLTELKVDAIVNAANAQLVLGGGVAGAVRAKGGPSIQEECNRIGPIQVGESAITGGGRLQASHVIHAVGPRMGEGDEDRKLVSATTNSLLRATENGLDSIAFPAVSTGIFGFPKDRCARIMLGEVKRFLEEEQTSLQEVVFCLWSGEDMDIFRDMLQFLMP